MKLSDGAGWINAKSCQDGDIVEFVNDGEWRDSNKFTYDDGSPVRQLVFRVLHEGEEKQLGIIKPSRVAMIEAYSDDTSLWIGKKAKISLVLNTQGGKSIILSAYGDATPVNPKSAEEGEEIPF